jgi:hypothetical protein
MRRCMLGFRSYIWQRLSAVSFQQSARRLEIWKLKADRWPLTAFVSQYELAISILNPDPLLARCIDAHFARLHWFGVFGHVVNA